LHEKIYLYIEVQNSWMFEFVEKVDNGG
jgi:hypothetical protein